MSILSHKHEPQVSLHKPQAHPVLGLLAYRHHLEALLRGPATTSALQLTQPYVGDSAVVIALLVRIAVFLGWGVTWAVWKMSTYI